MPGVKIDSDEVFVSSFSSGRWESLTFTLPPLSTTGGEGPYSLRLQYRVTAATRIIVGIQFSLWGGGHRFGDAGVRITQVLIDSDNWNMIDTRTVGMTPWGAPDWTEFEFYPQDSVHARVLFMIWSEPGSSASLDGGFGQGFAVVPIPAAVWMGLGLLSGIGVIRKIRHKRVSTSIRA